MSHGLELSLAGAVLFFIGLILLTVFDPIAIAAIIAGGLIVFSGLLWTFRTKSNEL
jgi:hypothetical protein